MQKNKNTIIFVVLSVLILLGWFGLTHLLYPPKEPPPRPPDAMTVAALIEGAGDQTPGALGLGNAARLLAVTAAAPRTAEVKLLAAAPKPPAEKPPAEQPAQPPPVVQAKPEPPPGPPITMGNDSYFLNAKVRSEGASVISVTARQFQQVDEFGRPMWLDDAHTQPKPLELVQESKNQDEGSVLLYQADPDNADARPFVTLGKKRWEPVETGLADDGVTVNKVVFQTDAGDVRITKTYTLGPRDYHIGLDVRFERGPNAPADKDIRFRYHVTSPHGLPIEGEWYTNTQRNAVIGRVNDQGTAKRGLQALRTLTLKGEGEEMRADGEALQYGGVAVQYFSSLVVVDESQLQDKFLVRATPTIVSAVLRGRVAGDMRPDSRTFDLLTKDGDKFTFLWPKKDDRDQVQVLPQQRPLFAGEQVAVVYRMDEHYRYVAQVVYTGDEANKLLFGDINVDLVSEAFELKAGAEPVTHKYLLYNGPTKVRMLDYLERAECPDPALVNRYADTLHLKTLTDAPSPGWWGDNVWGPTGWTWLVVSCTNVMHWVLWALHHYLMPWSWSWGLCILLLTVVVRGAMHPLSRRQALTGIRMQSLAPEIKKLQEKYKDDRQALGMAQMDLYRKHGVNPMGSCWTIFLQMPIFLGLYYSLQESLNFRLAPLFPWIKNLAAPDMLFYWSQSIPWISTPQSYPAMYYLGPYFNLLPVIVAAFMYVQQQMLTPQIPDPTDEQKMQQRMMKFMTVFFALMFYKMAAGLCLYFIASSLWGFTERTLLLPKRKPGETPPSPPEQTKPTLFQRALDQFQALARPQPTSTAITATPPAPAAAAPAERAVQATPPAGGQGKRKSKKKRREERNRRRIEAGGSNGPALTRDGPTSGPARQSNGSRDGVQAWWGERVRRLHAWWVKLLRSAEKR